jgi:hypothetical protein
MKIYLSSKGCLPSACQKRTYAKGLESTRESKSRSTAVRDSFVRAKEKADMGVQGRRMYVCRFAVCVLTLVFSYRSSFSSQCTSSSRVLEHMKKGCMVVSNLYGFAFRALLSGKAILVCHMSFLFINVHLHSSDSAHIKDDSYPRYSIDCSSYSMLL